MPNREIAAELIATMAAFMPRDKERDKIIRGLFAECETLCHETACRRTPPEFESPIDKEVYIRRLVENAKYP